MPFLTYQVTYLSWCCPDQLLYVRDGAIIGGQHHPTNGLTRWWWDDDDDLSAPEPFNPGDFLKCEQILPSDDNVSKDGSVYSLV